mgnify:CR=1 FL=1
MDEAERCTEVGFIESGRLLAKAPPRNLKASFRTKLLEIDVDPVMPALVRLRNLPGILGVSLRSGALRIYAPDPERLISTWQTNWPFPDLKLLGKRWVEPDMEDVFTAYSQRYDALLTSPANMKHEKKNTEHRTPNIERRMGFASVSGAWRTHRLRSYATIGFNAQHSTPNAERPKKDESALQPGRSTA